MLTRKAHNAFHADDNRQPFIGPKDRTKVGILLQNSRAPGSPVQTYPLRARMRPTVVREGGRSTCRAEFLRSDTNVFIDQRSPMMRADEIRANYRRPALAAALRTDGDRYLFDIILGISVS